MGWGIPIKVALSTDKYCTAFFSYFEVILLNQWLIYFFPKEKINMEWRIQEGKLGLLKLSWKCLKQSIGENRLSFREFFSSIVWINPNASCKTFYSDKLKKSWTDYSEHFHPEIATPSSKVSFSYFSHNDLSF